MNLHTFQSAFPWPAFQGAEPGCGNSKESTPSQRQGSVSQRPTQCHRIQLHPYASAKPFLPSEGRLSPFLSPSGAAAALVLHLHFILPSHRLEHVQLKIGGRRVEKGADRLAEKCVHEPETWHHCPERLSDASLTQPCNFPFAGEGWNSRLNCS